MPIPGFPSFHDEQLFSALNLVLPGWLLLALFPSWQLTHRVTLALVFVYSVLYTLLVAHALTRADAPPVDFSSLDGVASLFSDRAVAFAGWTHYIALDLLVGRWIVLDAASRGVPHAAVVVLLPLTLMAAPAGVAAYLLLRELWARLPPASTFACWVLAALYALTCALAAFMVVWICVFPSSWLSGHSSFHDRRVSELFAMGSQAMPETVILKYRSAPLVQLTHILPAAAWAALLPFQLHPSSRTRYPALHRRCGYALFGTALSIAFGFALIDRSGLYYHLADFPTLQGSTSALGLGWLDHVMALRVVATWFTLTICLAVRKAQLGEYTGHRAFMIRHVAAGLWVAGQRLYVIGCAARTPEAQKANFGDGGVVAFVAAAAMAEGTIALLSNFPIIASRALDVRAKTS